MKNQLFIGIASILVSSMPVMVTAQGLFATADSQIYDFSSAGTPRLFATVQPGNADGIAFDEAGNLFVPNSNDGTILEIAPDGAETTFASGFVSPSALAFNSAGDLFVSDVGTMAIYEITPEGQRSTFATGLYVPYGMVFNSAGNLFVASESAIYEFTPSGAKSTFASVPGEGIAGLAFDSAGNLFASVGGTVGYIDEWTPSGKISTFASGLDEPFGLAFNSAGNLFEADWGGISHIYEFTPSGVSSTFASGVGAAYLAFGPAPVPEPPVWALFGIGCLALFGFWRKDTRRVQCK